MCVSYVLTVYNKERFLPAVLAGVDNELSQTGGTAIAVNDGSQDGSAGILDAWAAGRNNVRVIHQQNQGVAAATNRGITSAEDAYIRLVDADDILVPGSTLRLRQALQKSGAALVYGNKVLYSLGAPLPDVAGDKGTVRLVANPLRAVLNNNDIVPSVTLGRREVLQSITPLPEDVRTAQDFVFAARISAVASVAFLDGDPVCYFAAEAEARLSSSKAVMFSDTCRLLKQHIHGKFSFPEDEMRRAIYRNVGRARLFILRHSKASLIDRLHLLYMLGKTRLSIYHPAESDLDYLIELYCRDRSNL